MKIFIYVVSVMIITMVIYLIGYYKEKTLPLELTNNLYRKCAKVVVDYLEVNNTASISEIKKSITGITASVFWSKKKLGVTKPAQFAENIVSNLIKQGIIAEVDINNKKMYKLI